MKLRNRLVPIGALVVAIGASAAGAATAAEGGKGDKPKSDPAIVKCEGKVGGEKDKGDKGDKKDKGDKGSGPVQKQEPDWNAVAKKLGVTAQQLEDALRATKIWIGEAGDPTPDMFVQHVADLLHQPVDKVKSALEDAGVFRDDSGKGKDRDKSPDQSDKRDKSSDQKDKGDKGSDKAGDKPGDKAGDKATDDNTDQAPDKAADPDATEQ
ncbi:MAG: hypothetical protein HOV83_04380 [Catenulispora sp.]|nr:hypothetical protein [Catenulispora sp.]